MWFRDLLTVLFDRDSERVGAAYPQMLDLAVTTFYEVNTALWDVGISDELRADVYSRDVRINQLERAIRKKALTHLAINDTRDLAFCFVLINVVKDTERIGDYVKNMLDPVIKLELVPDGELKSTVRELGLEAGRLLERVCPVFEQAKRLRRSLSCALAARLRLVATRSWAMSQSQEWPVSRPPRLCSSSASTNVSLRTRPTSCRRLSCLCTRSTSLTKRR